MGFATGSRAPRPATKPPRAGATTACVGSPQAIAGAKEPMGPWHPAAPTSHLLLLGEATSVVACTRMLARRPHNSGPRCSWGRIGASPTRPARASPTLSLALLVASGRMAAGIALHKPGVLGDETNRAPQPASCGRPRLHRMHRALYQRPQTSLQVCAEGPPRQAFPCSPLQPSAPFALAALPRCTVPILLHFLSYTVPFVSAIPGLRSIFFGAVSLQEPEPYLLHACTLPARGHPRRHGRPTTLRCMRIRPVRLLAIEHAYLLLDSHAATSSTPSPAGQYEPAADGSRATPPRSL